VFEGCSPETPGFRPHEPSGNGRPEMDGHPRQDPAYGLLQKGPSVQLDEGPFQFSSGPPRRPVGERVVRLVAYAITYAPLRKAHVTAYVDRATYPVPAGRSSPESNGWAGGGDAAGPPPQNCT